MSTQQARGGTTGRNTKKSHNKTSGSGGGGGGGGSGDGDAVTQQQSSQHHKKSANDAVKNSNSNTSTEQKEKLHPKPTAEQLRIAQLTSSNVGEDPQMREKVTTLIEMTQRSEEEVCCALNECDNNMERAVVFLFESLPVGSFETSSKKKKPKAANAGTENAADDWQTADGNANVDKREKSRQRSSNRGGRGGTDSRGWRGREARENDRNSRDTRGGGGGGRDGIGGGGGGGRDERNGNMRSGGMGRGGGYAGRSGRGGGRMGGRGGGMRGERNSGGGGSGGYGSRQNNFSDEHQEVELWDNTIATNAEKQQQQQTQDDAWGDWDNEEYVGSLKDSKVFTTSNLPNQTAASIVSGGGGSGAATGLNAAVNAVSEIPAPPGLEHHLGTSVLSSSPSQPQGSHLNALVSNAVGNNSNLGDDNLNVINAQTANATPMLQYSAAVSNSTPQQQQSVPAAAVANAVVNTGLSQYNSGAVDTFSNAATAAANLVQQVQQQQQQQQQQQVQIPKSATLSAEQSQYFNSLTSQNTGAINSVQQQQQQQQQQLPNYGQNSNVQYANTYATVFATAATGNVAATVPVTDPTHLGRGDQHVRRPRAKLPPPSKIPLSAVEMPSDNLRESGYVDVQFGQLDFVNDDSFDTLTDKFNAVSLDPQQVAAQQQDVVVVNDYQNKNNVQQQQSVALAATLQGSQLYANSQTDSLTGGYAQRGVSQQPQVVSNVNATGPGNVVEQLGKNDPYNQTNAGSATYQNSYQSSGVAGNAPNAYQQSVVANQGYNSNNYVNSTVANSYQPQSYGSYKLQTQQNVGVQGVQGAAVGNSNSNQNIPVGGNSASSISNAYITSAYATQQSAYQSSQSVYGGSGLSNNSGVTANNVVSNVGSGTSVSSSGNTANNNSNNNTTAVAVSTNTNNVSNVQQNSSVNANNSGAGGVVVSGSNANNGVAVSGGGGGGGVGNVNSNNNQQSAGVNNVASSTSAVVASNAVVANATGGSGGVGGSSSSAASVTSKSSAGSGNSMVPTNIQMVSQYIQTGLPYYQQPVYYEDIQMMQQRVPHVQGYYDINYTTPTSLGAGRDNMGSVAYSAMTDGRFARTDNNSSPVSNVSSTMSQQAGSGGPMLNVPYAYFYGGNVMPSGFQYGTPAIYPQQISAANTASGGQYAKPSYNTGYGSTSYDTLSQASQDYGKNTYPTGVNQQTKSQNVNNQPQAGSGSDLTSSMYGKGHVTLNKVNSYEKQNFHSATPPPFNMPNTQAGGTSAQPYGMYLPMPTGGHHNMIHQPIHQDSNSTGQRQGSSSQSKSGSKQNYSPSYWTGQN